jgi:hypothetical protein
MRKTPVTLGVLAMIFGGLQALTSLVGLVSQPYAKKMMGGFGKAFSNLPKQEGQPDMSQVFERLAKVTEELKVYTYITNAGMVVLSIALFVVGWLLYKRRVQARPLSIGWAIAALAYLPVLVYIQVKIIQPRTLAVTQQMLEQMPNASNSSMQAFAGIQGVFTVIFYVLFYTPFPIVLLLLMGRSSAKNDLVGPAPLPM